MFEINAKDPMPLYAQLESAVRLAIASGNLRTGEQLPTVRQLAVQLRINANTVAKVYASLEDDGVLETRRGVGTFVRLRDAGAAIRKDENQRLTDFVNRFLIDGSKLGFTVDQILEHLIERSKRR